MHGEVYEEGILGVGRPTSPHDKPIPDGFQRVFDQNRYFVHPHDLPDYQRMIAGRREAHRADSRERVREMDEDGWL